MWLALSVVTDASRAEALGDALLEQGAISATVEDADAGTDREVAQYGEPGAGCAPLWARSRLVALLPREADAQSMLRAAAATIGMAEPPAFELETVPEQDWVRLTQSQFEPIRVSDRLWIVPSWHEPPDPAATCIVLDPGLAFGTGSHPTTRLCLRWLSQRVRPGVRVLDYGCGSGILAIAAAKLGALRVTAVDIDEHALQATADNAIRNAVSMDIRHSREPLDTEFDLVVANILTQPLLLLAPLLARRVRAGGSLALSGILAEQAGQVIAAYAPHLALAVAETEEGWVRLEGRRT